MVACEFVCVGGEGGEGRGEEGVGKEPLCTYRIGKKVERGEREFKIQN